MITLYHNPQCSKSRAALALLEAHSLPITLIHYLDHPPSKSQLRQLMQQLNMTSPRAMMRTQEPLYHTLQLDQANDEQLLTALVAHPILLERPIAVYHNHAVIGRPTDNIQTLINLIQH